MSEFRQALVETFDDHHIPVSGPGWTILKGPNVRTAKPQKQRMGKPQKQRRTPDKQQDTRAGSFRP